MTANALLLNDATISARPDGESSTKLHLELRKRLRTSTLGLALSAQKGLKADLSSLMNRCEALDTTRRFSPAVFIGHYALLDGLNQQSTAAVRSAVEQLANLEPNDWYSPELHIKTLDHVTWEQPVLERLRAHPVPDRFGHLTRMDPLGPKDFARYQSNIAKAFELIESADPEMRKEVDELVSHIRLSQGSGITGATSLQFFGAIFLREPYPEYHHVMYFFEHIVHETSHLRLNMLQTIDNIVLNPRSELYTSPLRRDPRPVMGIYHAVYVLSRLVHMYRLVQPIVDEPIFVTHSQMIEEKFRKGYATLNEVSNLTHVGRKLLDSMGEITA